MNWILLSLCVVTSLIGVYSQATPPNDGETKTSNTTFVPRYILRDKIYNKTFEYREKQLKNGTKVQEKITKVEIIEITTNIPDDENFVVSKIVYEVYKMLIQLSKVVEERTKSNKGILVKTIEILKKKLRNKELSKHFRSILTKQKEYGESLLQVGKDPTDNELKSYLENVLREISGVSFTSQFLAVERVNEEVTNAVKGKESIHERYEYKELLISVVRLLLQNEKNQTILDSIETNCERALKMYNFKQKKDIKIKIDHMLIRTVSLLGYRIIYPRVLLRSENLDDSVDGQVLKTIRTETISSKENIKVDQDGTNQDGGNHYESNVHENKYDEHDASKSDVNTQDGSNGEDKTNSNQEERVNEDDKHRVPHDDHYRNAENPGGDDNEHKSEPADDVPSSNPDANPEDTGVEPKEAQHKPEPQNRVDFPRNENDTPKEDDDSAHNESKPEPKDIDSGSNPDVDSEQRDIEPKPEPQYKVDVPVINEPTKEDENNDKNKEESYIESNVDKVIEDATIKIVNDNGTELILSKLKEEDCPKDVKILDPRNRCNKMFITLIEEHKVPKKLWQDLRDIIKEYWTNGKIDKTTKRYVWKKFKILKNKKIPAEALYTVLRKKYPLNNLKDELRVTITRVIQYVETRKVLRNLIEKQLVNYKEEFINGLMDGEWAIIKGELIDQFLKMKDNPKIVPYPIEYLTYKVKKLLKKFETDMLHTLFEQSNLVNIKKNKLKKIQSLVSKKSFGQRESVTFYLVKLLLEELGYRVVGDEICKYEDRECVKNTELLQERLKENVNIQQFNDYVQRKLYEIKFANKIVHNKHNKCIRMYKTYEDVFEESYCEPCVPRMMAEKVQRYRKLLTYLKVLKSFKPEEPCECSEGHKILFNKHPEVENSVVYRQNTFDAGYLITLDSHIKLVDASIQTFIIVDDRDKSKIKETLTKYPYINKGDPLPGKLKRYETIVKLEFITKDQRNVNLELELLDNIDVNTFNIDLTVEGIEVKGKITPHLVEQKTEEVERKLNWRVVRVRVHNFVLDLDGKNIDDIGSCSRFFH